MEYLFVDPVMEKIIDASFEYLKDQVRWQTGMKEELQRLRDLHPKIQAVIFAASQQQVGDQNSAFKEWLWQLRDAIEEADDVLDEFLYLKYKKQLARNKEKTKELHCTSFIIEGARKFFERSLKIDPSLKRLEEVVHKLVNVSTEVSLFNIEKQEQQKQQLELYKTRVFALPTNNLIGRREEWEKILQWLRNSSNEDQSHITSSTLYKNISLLSIVGHGGMGKTTLLQHAYDNEITKEFDVKMWVCVSTNFDVKRIITDMLQSLKNSKCDLDSLEELQKRLKSEVDSKKFLLVLDDIWEDEEKDKIKWENIFAPLASGSLGSKIMVTTRTDSVASMIANVLSRKDHTILTLGGMKEDECLQLLSNYAFATVENPDAHKKSILKQIVKKVLGSPLAAKVIGGALSDNMDESHWIGVLKSDIGSIEESQNFIFPILKLSYMFLPKPLQSCFSFCSIFPQDHEFDKDDLIRMWIALNFIQPSSKSRETMEDIGERYFDTLVKKSFFDKFQNNKTYYKMHDLLHELAQFVSARECCRVTGDEELSNCETIRHLSVETYDLEVLRKIKNFKKLRSLFLFCGTDNHKTFTDVLSEIFKASSSIRLLFIDAECQMPEAIGDLIHLRYLKCDIGGNVTQLLRSICTLYHMNFIICTSWIGFIPFDFLPRDMNNLFNLRYVELPWHKLPLEKHLIWEPRPLQRLNNFFVKNEAGYRINELKHKNELCELRIYQLENVKDAVEARSAKFCNKRSLTELSLHWGEPSLQWDDHTCHRNNVDSNLDEEVFDNLQPHNNLKRLTISAYMGTRSAIWMKDVKFISNLERIELEGCLEWQTLPPFGQLHFLKSLYLHKMPKVKGIGGWNDKDRAFPSLEVLHIEDLDALEDWFDAAAANDSLFPCLIELCLKRCPNLQVLPSLPPKLQRLEMANIRWKGFSWLQGAINCYKVDIQDCGDFPGIFTYLKTTEIGQFKDDQLKIRDPSELLMEPLKSIISVIDQSENIQPMASNLVIKDPSVSNQISLGGHQEADESENIQPMASNLVIKDPSISNQISLGGHQEADESENIQPMASNHVIKDPSELLMEPLRSITSLEKLTIVDNDELVSFPIEAEQWFRQVSSSLLELSFKWLIALHTLPSLTSLSSLKILHLEHVPQLRELSDIPASLERLELSHLRSLQCLPSLLSSSSLKYLSLTDISVKKLPCLPPSLRVLKLDHLEYLDCLPNLSSLEMLFIKKVSQLRKLPDLPSYLRILALEDLKNLDCLPSCSFDLSIQEIFIDNVPRLRKLPYLPPSLEKLSVYNCHPELMECYRRW